MSKNECDGLAAIIHVGAPGNFLTNLVAIGKPHYILQIWIFAEIRFFAKKRRWKETKR